MSWRDFILYSVAFDRKEISEWNKVRQICFTIVRMNGDPKKVPNTPQSFWSLPIDEKPRVLSQEEISQIAAKYSRSTSQLTGKA